MFSILVLFTTTRLIKQSIAVLMEGVPDGIDPDEVEEALMNVPGVIGQQKHTHAFVCGGSDTPIRPISRSFTVPHSFPFSFLLDLLVSLPL